MTFYLLFFVFFIILGCLCINSAWNLSSVFNIKSLFHPREIQKLLLMMIRKIKVIALQKMFGVREIYPEWPIHTYARSYQIYYSNRRRCIVWSSKATFFHVKSATCMFTQWTASKYSTKTRNILLVEDKSVNKMKYIENFHKIFLTKYLKFIKFCFLYLTCNITSPYTYINTLTFTKETKRKIN